jgi:hypothetical protein
VKPDMSVLPLASYAACPVFPGLGSGAGQPSGCGPVGAGKAAAADGPSPQAGLLARAPDPTRSGAADIFPAKPADARPPPMRRILQRQELVYGSREFTAASDWVRSLPLSPLAIPGSVARHPAALRVLVHIWRLPVIDLRVRQADADAWWFGDWFGPGLHKRLARAVLDLPANGDRYIGVTSARVSYETWFDVAAAIQRARGGEPDPLKDIHQGPAAYYVARDADGTPLAFAGVALFGQFAVLFALTSGSGRRPETSWARYQLHTCLAVDLGGAGVRHLLVGSALREPVGLQYFQHLLGYQPRNLRVERVLSPLRTGWAWSIHPALMDIADSIKCRWIEVEVKTSPPACELPRMARSSARRNSGSSSGPLGTVAAEILARPAG